MKKTVLVKTMMVGMALMLITAFSSAWAACGTSVMIANRAIGGQLNVPGILDDGSGNGSIITKFWLQGNSENYNSGKLETIYQWNPGKKTATTSGPTGETPKSWEIALPTTAERYSFTL